MSKTPRAPRASVGVALIAKDAAAVLPTCLASLRPHVAQIVVGVDERTTDRTAKVARRAGADVVRSLAVSDWHECAQHGRVLAQDFAAARNQTFAWLDRSLDYWLWVDADDVLENGDRLAEMLTAVPPDAIGVWLPYYYAWSTTPNGERRVNTLFHRERLLRTQFQGRPVPWNWRYRVHEVVEPGLQAPWIKADDVRIVHQEGAHKTATSATRNLLLLEIDYEHDPDDHRTIFYIGNQHFAMGNWPAAVHWYERLVSVGKNPYETWQSYVYLCKAYQKLGDPGSALRAAFGALAERPEHPEPYYALAEVYAMTGEWDKVLFWTNEGRQRPEPPFFVFKNPLDYSFNCHLPAADALGQLGRIGEARRELEAAYAVMPNPQIGEAIDRYRETEQHASQASALAVTLESLPDDDARVRLWAAVDPGPSIRQFGRVRDVVMPAYLRQRPNTQPLVTFWCGPTSEPWAPPSLETTGIGGSETAVIQIARRFAVAGWRAEVYNGADRYEGLYGGVGYWDAKRLAPSSPADLFVSWRRPGDAQLGLAARHKVAWLHDLHHGPDAGPGLAQWDRVVAVSAWHARQLQRYYGLPAEQLAVARNGVDLSRFDPSIRKLPYRCVYTSSPDRGLHLLLGMWELIAAQEPAAELHVAYGWQGFDYFARNGHPELAEQKAELERQMAAIPSVKWRGRLAQPELARLYGESVAWLYPSTFLETSCISAMEAMAAGAVAVTSTAGAIKETIGPAGYVIPGSPYSRVWQEFYLHIVRAVLGEVNTRKTKEWAGRERAQGFTWDAAFQQWLTLWSALIGEQSRQEPPPKEPPPTIRLVPRRPVISTVSPGVA